MKAAKDNEVDFIFDLGDFCHVKPENKPMAELMKTSGFEYYAALGNHDMDFATKREYMDFIGMETNYYTFDKNGFHFIVLDPNHILVDGEYKDYENANFYIPDEKRAHIDPKQIEWLKKDLKQKYSKPESL